MEQRQGTCARCQAPVLLQREGVNHTLHFVLGLFTCSLWWGVWLFIALFGRGKWRCTRCGQAV